MADEIPPSPPTSAISAEPLNMPPIPLDGPAPAPKPAPPSNVAKKETEVKDSFRDLIETIVFVVVLVLMLKTFLAEAFVIPTGSMADTLLGYHYKRTCRQCGYSNLINAHHEAEPANPREPPRLGRYRCQNCNQLNDEPERGPAP